MRNTDVILLTGESVSAICRTQRAVVFTRQRDDGALSVAINFTNRAKEKDALQIEIMDGQITKIRSCTGIDLAAIIQ